MAYSFYHKNQEILAAIPEAAVNETVMTLMAEMDFILPAVAAEPVSGPVYQAYMLGLHEGYVTIFYGADGTKGIKEVTQTPAHTLPREEWIRLAVGIQANDEEELTLLLQDYGS
jgi:hypothetical protein